MTISDWQTAYIRLHPQSALRRLERPCLYHIGRDQVYELSGSSENFLACCDGTKRGKDLNPDPDFLAYCITEGLVELSAEPSPVPVTVRTAPLPSLRYLELQLLHRCNLRCRHCYLGPRSADVLSLEDALHITREFESIGGLRLLISGGEPLLYPHVKEFLEATHGMKLRRVLATNGTMVNEHTISWLQVDELQFSLDGWRIGHEMLRGTGTFELTIQGIHAARKANIPVSIATMIHRYNLDEFDTLWRFVQETGVIAWGIDAMCIAGSLKQNHDIIVPYEQAAPFMHYAFGRAYHGSSDGFACGRHCMTVLPTGQAVKCGFYEEAPLGDARTSLTGCRRNLKHIPLDRLECKGCEMINDCAGGCRFRAPHPHAPDPVMCTFYRDLSHVHSRSMSLPNKSTATRAAGGFMLR